MTGGLKMGVNVAAHTRHIFLGSAPRDFFMDLITFMIYHFCSKIDWNNDNVNLKKKSNVEEQKAKGKQKVTQHDKGNEKKGSKTKEREEK